MLAIVWWMVALTHSRGGRVAALIALICLGLAAAGCGSSTSSGTGSTPKVSKTVSVAYAASLQFLNGNVVSPAFKTATGDTVSGRAGASGDLESDIASGEITPNVFESVGG